MFHCGERKRERGTAPCFTLHPDLTAMRFHDRLRNWQAQTCAVTTLRGLPERIEETRHMLGRDAGTLVANGKADCTVLRGSLQRNNTSLRAELECISYKV